MSFFGILHRVNSNVCPFNTRSVREDEIRPKHSTNNVNIPGCPVHTHNSQLVCSGFLMTLPQRCQKLAIQVLGYIMYHPVTTRLVRYPLAPHHTQQRIHQETVRVFTKYEHVKRGVGTPRYSITVLGQIFMRPSLPLFLYSTGLDNCLSQPTLCKQCGE